MTDKPITHITFTGAYAGVPFCQCDKEQARVNGDTFSHLPYSGDIEKWFVAVNACPNCVRAYHDAD